MGVTRQHDGDLSCLAVGFNLRSGKYECVSFTNLLPSGVRKGFQRVLSSFQEYGLDLQRQRGPWVPGLLQPHSMERTLSMEFLQQAVEGTLLHGPLVSFAGILIELQTRSQPDQHEIFNPQLTSSEALALGAQVYQHGGCDGYTWIRSTT